MPPTRTGTLSIDDLLANKQTTAADFDASTIVETFEAYLAAHNRLTDDMVTPFADPTEDRLRQAGATDTAEMIEADEFGRVPTQKPDVGDNLGVPLKKFDFAVGWTREFLEAASVADLANRFRLATIAHVRKLLAEAKRAIYLSANYNFFDRYEAPNVTLPVKRLINADSFPLPSGPNGEVYDTSTHTHYLANATLTAAAATSLVNTVLEHYPSATVNIAIAQADEAAWRALTGFSAFVDARLSLIDGQPTQRLEVPPINNRAIGLFAGATVWVKPWAIANYDLAYVTGGAPKPLAYRQPKGPRKGLRILADLDTHPLQARYMGAKFGFAVQERTAAAVLYHASGTYADPTISG